MKETSKSRNETKKKDTIIEQKKYNTISSYSNMISDDITDLYDTAYNEGYSNGYFTSFVEFSNEIKKDFKKNKADKIPKDEYVNGYINAIMSMNEKGYKMVHTCSTCKYYTHVVLAGGRTMNSYYCSLARTTNVCSDDFCSRWVKRKEEE